MKFSIILLLLLVGCSNLVELENEEKPINARVIVREPGSLWSTDSVWNNMYGPPKIVLGDLIPIRITERFKDEILMKIGEKSKKSEKKEEGSKVSSDSSTIYAKVIEIKPRGVYKIYAEDIVRIGGLNPTINFTGEIREVDLDKDDSISSDAIIGLNLNITNKKLIF